MIRRFRSERFTIAIKAQGYHRKIIQIGFSKRDGSFVVDFPYFEHSDGLACTGTLHAGMSYPGNISLIENSKVTSYRVKYSHHPDGRAHFSQDGKIYTVIKKESVPLAKAEDHVFTVQFQGLQDFKKVKSKDLGKSNEKELLLNINLTNSQSDAYKIVGRWYSKEQLTSRAGEFVEGPKVIGGTRDGHLIEGFMVSAPLSYPLSDYALFVGYQGIPKTSDNDSLLLFLGGFDSPEVANDHDVSTTFLALMYPVSNFEELEKTIGSMDFIRQLK